MEEKIFSDSSVPSTAKHLTALP